MHRTALARTQRRACCTDACSLRTRALENGLTGNGTTGRGTHCADRSTRLRGRNRTRRRSLVHRTGASLRHDHSRCWRLRRSRRRRRTRRCGGNWRLWRRRSRHRRRCGSARRRRHHRRRRRCNRLRGRRGYNGRGGRWRYWWNRRLLDHRRRNNRPDRSGRRCGSSDWWRNGFRRRRWSGRRDYGPGRNWRHGWRRHHDRLFFLRDGSQHIPRTGDVRQVNLSLDFFFAAQRTRRTRRRVLRLGLASDMGPYLVCFMVLD
jgi:hypothetical protein